VEESWEAGEVLIVVLKSVIVMTLRNVDGSRVRACEWMREARVDFPQEPGPVIVTSGIREPETNRVCEGSILIKFEVLKNLFIDNTTLSRRFG
jgi:hypothetical protein|tara:strand:- start:77 stop:355 length:279 start_codon:yes stop_codon:yes gene_type:complete